MRRIVALVAVLALAVVAPAAADDHEWEPDLSSERVYFTCGSTKVGNLNASQGETVGWSADEPADSYQAGAGCGHLDSAQLGGLDESQHMVFEGTFEGNLDTLTIHLHAFETAASRLFEGVYVDVTVLVDDWDYVWQEEVIIPPTSNDDVSLFELSVTDFELLDEDDATEHEVIVIISAAPYLADGDNTIWVWDAAEVPSGITFNPESLAETVVQGW